MGEELMARFIELVKVELGGTADGACKVNEAREMRDLELVTHECLMRLGRATIERLVEEAGTGYLGPRVKQTEVWYRCKGYRGKTVHGLFGSVTVRRAYYTSGTGVGWVPRDELLGISGGQTPACAYHLAQFVGHGAYQRSLEHFHAIFRPDGVEKVSLHKAEQTVDSVGAQLERERQQEIKQYAPEADLAVADEITGTMVVCIDAGKAPTKGNERIDNEQRKRYDREFRDVKVASMSSLEWDEKRQEARCRRHSYVLGIEHADEFFRRIEVEMRRRSPAVGHLPVVIIGDGADWIWCESAGKVTPGRHSNRPPSPVGRLPCTTEPVLSQAPRHLFLSPVPAPVCTPFVPLPPFRTRAARSACLEGATTRPFDGCAST